MKPNKLKDLFASGQPVINGWLAMSGTFSAEIMAAQGYDSLTVDLQHGAVDYSGALPMIQAMGASGAVPMARVPWREPGIIMKMLDAGCYGIICPMVNNADEAAEFISYLRYPPQGQRSFGPTRASFAQGGNIAAEANDQIMAWAMIETKEAFDNVDAIAATPGLDGLYIGPSDLTFGLYQGKYPPALDREEPEMIEAIKAIQAACKRAGILGALHCGSADYAARGVEWGFDMVTVSGDNRLLAAAAGESVARVRKLTGRESKAGNPGGY